MTGFTEIKTNPHLDNYYRVLRNGIILAVIQSKETAIEHFLAIVNYQEGPVGVSEIRADEYGSYRIYRNGEFLFSFGSKEKAIRCFIGMIGEPY